MVFLLDVGGSVVRDDQRLRLSYDSLDRDDLLFDPFLIEDLTFNDGWQPVLRRCWMHGGMLMAGRAASIYSMIKETGQAIREPGDGLTSGYRVYHSVKCPFAEVIGSA